MGIVQGITKQGKKQKGEKKKAFSPSRVIFLLSTTYARPTVVFTFAKRDVNHSHHSAGQAGLALLLQVRYLLSLLLSIILKKMLLQPKVLCKKPGPTYRVPAGGP